MLQILVNFKLFHYKGQYVLIPRKNLKEEACRFITSISTAK